MRRAQSKARPHIAIGAAFETKFVLSTPKNRRIHCVKTGSYYYMNTLNLYIQPRK